MTDVFLPRRRYFGGARQSWSKPAANLGCNRNGGSLFRLEDVGATGHSLPMTRLAEFIYAGLLRPAPLKRAANAIILSIVPRIRPIRLSPARWRYVFLSARN
jgi:hypothetical protein